MDLLRYSWNLFGCVEAQVYVTVLCNNILIYTGFSPNEDGFNDVFRIDGLESFPDNELQIFDCWGHQVFTTKSYNNDWKGEFNGKHLPDGTYFYVLSDGEGNTYSGYVQIHR